MSECAVNSEAGQQTRYVVDRDVFTQPQFDEVHGKEDLTEPEIHTKIANYARKHVLCTRHKCHQFILTFLPFLQQLYTYKPKKYIFGDVVSGFTVAVMHIPQGMAYGLLASLSPVNGLYTSFFPPLVYFFFGTSRHISVGTFAVISLMIAGVVDELILQDNTDQDILTDEPGSQEYTAVQVATALTMLVGFFHVGMYLLRLGSLTTFLSDQLIGGFTVGAAMHVIVSQAKNILGLQIQSFNGAFKLVYTLIEIFKNITKVNLAEIVISLVCIIVMVIVKQLLDPYTKPYIKMPIPIEVIVVIVSTGVTYAFDFNTVYNVSIVGEIPTGIPKPEVPPLELLGDSFVIGEAFMIAIVSFTVSVSMAKILAKQHGYQVDTNQELLAQGSANVVTAFFSGFASCASLSRSLVQSNVGGVTQVASIMSCIIMLLVLLVIGPLFETLPTAVLASIIVVALKGVLMKYGELPSLWRSSKTDFFIWFITWTATVFLDVKYGLILGVGWSLLTIVWHTQRPYIAIMGQLSNSNIYKDITVYEQAKQIPRIKIFRFEASLYFANAEFFRNRLYKMSGINLYKLKKEIEKNKERELIRETANSNMQLTQFDEKEAEELASRNKHSTDTKYIIVDCSMFGYIDLVGVNTLTQVIAEFDEVGVTVVLADCKNKVRKMFLQTNFFEKVSRDRLLFTVHDAVLFAKDEIAQNQERAIAGSHSQNHFIDGNRNGDDTRKNTGMEFSFNSPSANTSPYVSAGLTSIRL